MGEVGLFVETQDIPNVRYALIGSNQKVFGFEQLTCLNNLGNTLVHHSLTYHIEVTGAHK